MKPACVLEPDGVPPSMQVERVMVAFVESAAQRHRLPPMPRPQRKVVHEMAAAFGLTSQSMGHDPDRQLQLFKVGAPAAKHSSGWQLRRRSYRPRPPTACQDCFELNDGCF